MAATLEGQKKETVCMKIDFISQRRESLIVLPSILAAVRTRSCILAPLVVLPNTTSYICVTG